MRAPPDQRISDDGCGTDVAGEQHVIEVDACAVVKRRENAYSRGGGACRHVEVGSDDHVEW